MSKESTYTVATAVNLGVNASGAIFRVMRIEVFLGGLVVNLHTELRDQLVDHVRILDTKDVVQHSFEWMFIDDVEYLAETFKAERVDVFKQLVTSLGRLHRMQDAVKGLIRASEGE